MIIPNAGPTGLPAGMNDMRLSQALAGLGQTGQMFHFASKLIPGKQAKTMLNLMAMMTGAAATTKDPMQLMRVMQGPMSDIRAITKEDQGKRISEVMPSPMARPPMGPARGPMGGMPGVR